MSLERDRVVRLAGTQNLRDVGGLATVDGRQTRWGVLYRSDCLDRLDAEGQQWLIRAGLRSIIDLRDNGEVARAPNVFAGSPHVRYRRVPIWDEPLPAGQESAAQERISKTATGVSSISAERALPRLWRKSSHLMRRQY